MSSRTGPVGPRGDRAVVGYRSRAATELAAVTRDRKAAQVVAAHADSIEDCVELLAMLGLEAQESWGQSVTAHSPVPH